MMGMGHAVAAVRWAPGESVGLRGLAIYSASADGHICHLTLAESALVRQVSCPPCAMRQNTLPSMRHAYRAHGGTAKLGSTRVQ